MNTTSTNNSEYQNDTSNFADALKQRKIIFKFSADEIEESRARFRKIEGELKLEMLPRDQEHRQKPYVIYRILNIKTRNSEMLGKKKNNRITFATCVAT